VINLNRQALCLAALGAVSVLAMPVLVMPVWVAPALAKPPALQLVDVPLPRPRPTLRPAVAAASARHETPLPKTRPGFAGLGLRGSSAYAAVSKPTGLFAAHAAAAPPLRLTAVLPFASTAVNATSETDKAAVKQVLEFARRGKDADAEALKNTIQDPLARKLAEYLYLRSDSTNPGFERFLAFITTNPSWPHIPMLARRAENALWDDKRDDATVRSFFAVRTPSTAKGSFVYARALLAQGNRAAAEPIIHSTWQHSEFSREVEDKALELFRDILTPADYRARMYTRLFAGDGDAAMRSAQRLGGDEPILVRAFVAVTKKAGDARTLLENVPPALRHNSAYIFAKAEYLRRQEQTDEAAQLVLGAPTGANEVYDADQWWVMRRLLLRKVLDDGNPQLAYRLARDAAEPSKGGYRADYHFTAGWIALRFLNDPQTAFAHFTRIAGDTSNPHALARAGYWLGRAAEALGRVGDATTYYQQAAVHSATYYGQLARGRLGLTELGMVPPPHFSAEEHAALENLEIVRAVEILYELQERDLVASIYAELGESATDIRGLATLGEVALRHNDPRAATLMGKAAHSRGLPLDFYAFPTVGLPAYAHVGPAIEPAVAYSIARQESHFNQKVVSSAQAMGLMQVTPAAGQYIAHKFRALYDRTRLLTDPVYNMQMGSAELGDLIESYRGSYIMTFAGYNAGRGRVRQWVAAHGDPRDPKVDPVDWVELIPLSETRNYVQRVLENLQIYRCRFGNNGRLLIEADLHRGSSN
jgi:soluble lytic murein transglycosylase